MSGRPASGLKHTGNKEAIPEASLGNGFFYLDSATLSERFYCQGSPENAPMIRVIREIRGQKSVLM
jgi:hypothetical protein